MREVYELMRRGEWYVAYSESQTTIDNHNTPTPQHHNNILFLQLQLLNYTWAAIIMVKIHFEALLTVLLHLHCRGLSHHSPAVPAFHNYGSNSRNTRGLCVIDNPVLGLVAVLPIGMAQVSSVKMTTQVGDKVKKGDEIFYFQFGGSDVICVSQPKVDLKVDHFVVSPDGTYSRYGTVLARAPKK
ncbi:unnamed protein product [Fusarium graminearum]|uniref:Phosphatidylserine decarboxylase n=1 Tax=Gibberella zeae TaxID=5518 RepID=A0A4E9E829_GIBZA|nr:unnamed protein product [Fusarium graminearum]